MVMSAHAKSENKETPVAELVAQLTQCESLETCPAVRALIAAGPRIWPALEVGLKSPDEMVRFWTLGVLSEVPVPAARAAIGATLKDNKIRVRAAAAYALGAQGSKEVTSWLLQALADEDVNVRFAAAVALMRIKDPASVPGLIKACRDRDEEVRAYAVLALGDIGDRRATKAVLERLDEDLVSRVRGFAGLALGKLKDPSTFNPLMKHIRTELDPKPLAAIIFALGALGDVRAIDAIASHKEHPDPEVRAYVVDALALLKKATKSTGAKPDTR